MVRGERFELSHLSAPESKPGSATNYDIRALKLFLSFFLTTTLHISAPVGHSLSLTGAIFRYFTKFSHTLFTVYTFSFGKAFSTRLLTVSVIL